MSIFIIGSATVLVFLQASLLMLDREQSTWTFSLIQKRNAPDMQTLDMKACLDRFQEGHKQNESTTTADHCRLWYHTAQSIEPILTEWNPHLIVLCIACVHCIVTLYAHKKKHREEKAQTVFFSRRYAAGLPLYAFRLYACLTPSSCALCSRALCALGLHRIHSGLCTEEARRCLAGKLHVGPMPLPIRSHGPLPLHPRPGKR